MMIVMMVDGLCNDIVAVEIRLAAVKTPTLLAHELVMIVVKVEAMALVKS